MTPSQERTLASLRARFDSLIPAQRRVVHDLLAQHALGTWKAYVQEKGRITYVEGVVGTAQEVDPNLPADALAAVRSGAGVASVESRYLEPIAAMQDHDLELWDTAQFAYYAIYNYFNRYATGDAVDDWLLVNQAMSSEDGPRGALSLLERALAKVRS